ncbi:MAG: 16S rRNA (cytidine(1402)-2'-O)-methyltransferase [Bacteroidota bacterium]|jgi:16S rRNA (cytidine1402-2'-O)-methyltransferase|nr:16S rRNA (cytidine(1402)-2'-O)-methyltransferase [Ignavibacteria bacterium]MCU7500469.1 16S rRNA (cytidine(1402)-2'-O)-methyltransferase [Ignavibacteria bacterium]MCU7513582.1 16S rRNA (cytidine(1402)-2'-O)-methyltransferase [Ignavibacteria bacterium]MCU7520978.1 16S rRNA (cytidine(1402)-2'-O)-methyltransferase [Ignavibacteria bacterium]MCU7525073.1 16S rRNA (cytidine(1402)-2'-O)-methyltransferase [Ignavibacteria bacterium]
MDNKLYLVSTPIGNYDDITLRALNILKEADFIICEEFKEARRLLSQYKIEKELISLNEHNENEVANDILLRILQGESAALISDCGTPLFSDPGHLLVDLCISQKIEVVPVPGANSLLPALTASGFDFEKFYFYGWLSPKKDERRGELLRLKGINEVIVIMDTPYRLRSLLSDVLKAFGPSVRVALAYDITMKNEKFYRGTVSQVLEAAEKKQLKGEFVLIVNNRRLRRS